jgi:predicted nucleic acid-binding protein
VRVKSERPGGLVDTGALIALVDQREHWHQACSDAYEDMKLPLMTTMAVLAEAFYFAMKRGFRRQMWQFVRMGSISVAQIADADLPVLDDLMERYADRPMDFADATLVRVAEREGLETILTIDRADFETYRIGRNAKFRVLPAR